MADGSPKVLAIEWGSIEIDGFGVVKDAILQPGTAREWNWNDTGTRHNPGIQPADVDPWSRRARRWSCCRGAWTCNCR